jgi:hypothetical protein
MTANELLTKSLELVESRSIREWAVTPRNGPLWLQTCQTAIDNNKADPERMAAYIVCVAMGM